MAKEAIKGPNPLTERVGVNAVEAIFLNELNWAFREQTVSDYGIDAQVEVMEDGKPTGKLIALQIKSGEATRAITQDQGKARKHKVEPSLTAASFATPHPLG